MPDDGSPLSIDTNVASFIIRENSPLAREYSLVLEGQRLALTYFALGELEAAEWDVDKAERLAEFVQGCVRLGNPGIETRHWFAPASRVRSRLDLIQGTERPDLWMLAQTAEYGLRFLSHDYNAVRVAHSIGLDIDAIRLNRARLRSYIARDEIALTRQTT